MKGGTRVRLTLEGAEHLGTVIWSGHELLDGRVVPAVDVELDARDSHGRGCVLVPLAAVTTETALPEAGVMP